MTETLSDMILPVVILAGMALLLPVLFIPKETRSHQRVAGGMGASALVLTVVGATLYILFDKRPVYDGASLREWLAILRIVFVDSLSAAVVWVPILGLVWIGCAQRVERLRGEDLAREGR